MKLDAHPSVLRSGLSIIGILALVSFLAAAVLGYGTLAVISGSICVVAVASAMGLVGGVADGRDHTTHA